jgi:phosphoglycolate phosphatase
MRAPRAVAFDLDGTLIDSLLDIAAACNHVLTRAGRAPLPPERIATFVGDGVGALLSRAFGVPEVDAPDAERQGWYDEFIAYGTAHPAVYTTWMPGALEALDALSGLPLAIVTNKAHPVAVSVLDALGGTRRFGFVYGGGDGPLKPLADPVLAVARTFSVDVGSVWVVGDLPQDILAARAAGAVAIAVRGGFTDDARLEAARPDAILASLRELPGLVQRAAS